MNIIKTKTKTKNSSFDQQFVQICSMWNNLGSKIKQWFKRKNPHDIDMKLRTYDLDTDKSRLLTWMIFVYKLMQCGFYALWMKCCFWEEIISVFVLDVAVFVLAQYALRVTT